MVGKAIAAIGVALAFVGIWVDAFAGESYWSSDGTVGAFCLLLACLAALAFLVGFAEARNGPLLAVGAVMLGFYGFAPAIFAFDQWDDAAAGTWIALAAGALILLGAAIPYLALTPATTPARVTAASLTAGAGIALLFPGIFLDAVVGSGSYWDASGHSLGVVMLVVAIAAALVWVATLTTIRTHGIDQVLTLVALGLAAYYPVGAAWGDFGNLDTGAWLAFAGGILAAGGTWAARGLDAPRTAPASA